MAGKRILEFYNPEVYPVKQGRFIPWGYEPTQYDPKYLKPIRKQIKYLNEGLDMLDRGCSTRDVSAWISHETGRYISHVTLWKIFKKYRSWKYAKTEAKKNYRKNTKTGRSVAAREQKILRSQQTKRTRRKAS